MSGKYECEAMVLDGMVIQLSTQERHAQVIYKVLNRRLPQLITNGFVRGKLLTGDIMSRGELRTL